jgi:hypothetical protein
MASGTTSLKAISPKKKSDMVDDTIASYRLNKEIVEDELLQIFPDTTSVTLQVRVSGK